MNVWYFQTSQTGAQPEADVLAACESYLAGVFSDFDHLLDNNMNPVDIKVDIVTWQNGKWEVTANVGTTAFGGSLTTASTADYLPAGAAALGFLRTGLGKHQGRKFIGGLCEDSNSANGGLSTALATALTTGLTRLLTPFVFNTTEQLVSVVLDHTTGTVREVVEIAVPFMWAYQRRRRQGAGS